MSYDALLEKHIKLVEEVNNSTTREEHDRAEAKLEGYRAALDVIGGCTYQLIECDLHYLYDGVSRDMCCGVWLDWKPKNG